MAIAFTPLQPPTNEELIELGRRNPDLAFERGEHGELIVTPPANYDASVRNAELTAQLVAWNRRFGHGRVSDSSGGYDLPSGAMRAPDAGWVAGARDRALTAEQRSAFPPLCPDLVIELLATPTEARSAREKLRLFMRDGARVSVLIDPFRRVVETWTAGAETPTISGDAPVTIGTEWLDGADVPLVLDVARIFEP